LKKLNVRDAVGITQDPGNFLVLTPAGTSGMRGTKTPPQQTSGKDVEGVRGGGLAREGIQGGNGLGQEVPATGSCRPAGDGWLAHREIGKIGKEWNGQKTRGGEASSPWEVGEKLKIICHTRWVRW